MSTIAILGAGNVGQALATRALAAGHSVRFGVRDPDASRAELPSSVDAAAVMTAADAGRDASVVILAVPAAATVDVLRTATLAPGTIVVDATNPVRWDNGPVWAPPSHGSVAHAIAAEFPDLRVVKGFNHFGAEVMAAPVMDGRPVDALFATDDAAARDVVMALATSFGFHAIDAGPLRNAAVLENLAVLWIHRATVGGRGRYWDVRFD